MAKMNKQKTYAITNSETKKIVKYEGKLQYFRTYTFAIKEKKRLQKDLGIKLEIIKCI